VGDEGDASTRALRACERRDGDESSLGWEVATFSDESGRAASEAGDETLGGGAARDGAGLEGGADARGAGRGSCGSATAPGAPGRERAGAERAVAGDAAPRGATSGGSAPAAEEGAGGGAARGGVPRKGGRAEKLREKRRARVAALAPRERGGEGARAADTPAGAPEGAPAGEEDREALQRKRAEMAARRLHSGHRKLVRRPPLRPGCSRARASGVRTKDRPVRGPEAPRLNTKPVPTEQVARSLFKPNPPANARPVRRGAPRDDKVSAAGRPPPRLPVASPPRPPQVVPPECWVRGCDRLAHISHGLHT